MRIGGADNAPMTTADDRMHDQAEPSMARPLEGSHIACLPNNFGSVSLVGLVFNNVGQVPSHSLLRR